MKKRQKKKKENRQGFLGLVHRPFSLRGVVSGHRPPAPPALNGSSHPCHCSPAPSRVHSGAARDLTPARGTATPPGSPRAASGQKRRRESARDGSTPAGKARVTPSEASPPPPAPICSPVPTTIDLAREINRPVTRNYRQNLKNAQANSPEANENAIAPMCSQPAWKARMTPAAPLLPPPTPLCSQVLATIEIPAREVNRRITRSFSQLLKSSWANAAMANEGNSTTFTSTRTDDMESLRIRVILAESEVAREKENVRRGLEEIRRKNVQLKKLKKKSNAMDKDIRTKDALLKEAEDRFNRTDTNLERTTKNMRLIWNERNEKAAELKKVKAEKDQAQELNVQKEAEVLKVMKENVRLLQIVDKKEAQLQAMSEQCKLLALRDHN